MITLLLDRRRPGATHGEESSPAGPWTVASAAGAAWASATLWLYLRGGLDPTPTGGILAASGGASGFFLGRWLAARRPGGAWSAAAVGALALLSTGALLSLAVPWLQPRLPAALEAYPPWAVLDLALFAPPALAAFLFGLATPAARRRWEIDASLLAAVGAAIPIAVHLGSRGPLLMVIAGLVTGVGALLLASARPARLGGLLMASLVALGAWCLPAVEDRAIVSGWGTVLAGVVSPATWAAQRDEARWSTRHIGPDGTWALRTATSTPVADVDGVPLRGTGRAAEATMAAARLLALTAPQTRRLLVLGDDLASPRPPWPVSAREPCSPPSPTPRCCKPGPRATTRCARACCRRACSWWGRRARGRWRPPGPRTASSPSPCAPGPTPAGVSRGAPSSRRSGDTWLTRVPTWA
ncbi:MAG: hypothetical protein ABIO70_23020 [Pseudomonadota bacterium]